MTTLTDVQSFLAAGLRDDPLLCLAHAVAWLDPFWDGPPDDAFDDDGTLVVALDVVRDCFPGVYALAVEALHRGAAYDELDRLICAEVSALGIPLDGMESLSYGIPLPAYGALLHEPDFYAEHSDVVPVVELFGIQPESDDPIDIPGHLYDAARNILHDLIEHPDERYQRVGWLVGWLGGVTNNSSVDIDYETLWDYEPLTWEPENVEFALAIIQEADEIMESAQAGLALVQSHPHIQQALQDNIQRLYCSFARQSKKERKNHDCPRLHWPAFDSGLAGTTESDT